jgi:SAM-dependent methyltransferase
MSSQSAQRILYDAILPAYERHYDDPCSQRYRHEFIYKPLFGDLDLGGAEVLEAMCGSGQTSEYLLGRGARVTGLDISGAAIASFRRRFPQCRSVCQGILQSGLPDEAFDYVVVIGGLHHLHPQVTEGITEILRVLRPGGQFCFTEPHAGSLPDLARRLWYRCDPLFVDNEQAVDVSELRRVFADRCEFIAEAYGGNLAYLLVLNSLIFRFPLRCKRYYTPPLLLLERLLRPLQNRLLSCYVNCRWRKK